MKTKLLFLSLLLFSITSFQLQAAISSEGWYYAVKPISGGADTIYLKGAYSTEEICDEVRWADYGDGDSLLPWEGGPGCHYIYESDIDNANELYGISQPFEPVVIIGLSGVELELFINNVRELENGYNIQRFKQELDQLIQDTVRSNQR